MLLVYYMLIINILAFILYGVDKKKAEKEKYRIPESRLILVAVLGGAFGALLGMISFHHKTKKTKFRVVVPVFAVLYAVLMAVFLYGNYHLVTTEYEYASVDVSEELDGYTIVQISDLHNQLFGIGDSSLMKDIKAAEPDIIVVTGDAVDMSHTSFKLAEVFFEGAVKIAPVYYISGNHEKWLADIRKESYDKFIQDIQAMGVNCIDDKTVDMQGFTLAGVSEWSLGGEINVDNKLNGAEDNHSEDNIEDNVAVDSAESDLVVMLAHEPGYLSDYSKAGADVVLTGHNHGGQIVIPGKGGLVSADFEFFPELCEGVHTEGKTAMIISRGLGNSLFPVRINNYPEIVKVVLRKEEHKLMHVYMPELVGLNVESAENKLKNLGFFNVIVEYEKADGIEPGQVIRQSIPADTTVSTEFEITIYVAE